MEEKNRLFLNFEAIAMVDQQIGYGISYDFNALFKVNINTGYCEYLTIVPEEEVGGKRLYTYAVYTNNKVYFVPFSAKQIAVYDISTKKIYKLDIKEADVSRHSQYKKKNKFSCAIVRQKYIFMIPSTYPAIIRIDIETDQIVYFADWIENQEFLFRKSFAVKNDKIYIPSSINNNVLEFDMISACGSWYKIGNKNMGAWGICELNGCLWLSPLKPGPIIKWNLMTKECNEYFDFPKNFKDNKFLFTEIYESNGKLCVIPAYANMGIVVSEDGKMEELEALGLKDNNVTRYMFEFDTRIYLWASNGDKEERIVIDKNNNQIDHYCFYCSGEKYQIDYYNELIRQRIPCRESRQFGLNELLSIVKMMDA